MSSEEPPAGQQPNPYGPPPGQQPWQGGPPPTGWGPPGQQPPTGWGPPSGQRPGTSPYGNSPYGPPSGDPTQAPWQPTPPTGGGRRSGIIALVVVLVLLVAGGGTAIALTRGDGDGDAKKEEKTSEPSGDQSATDPAPPSDSGNIEPTDPLSSSDAGPDGPAAPGDGVPTEKWRGSPRASEYRDDWEFKWEGNVYNARAVVARDHADCAEIATDTQLDDIGCARAVTATYVNERDKVTITHFFLRMDTRAAARKVEKRKDADTLLTIDGDAVWQDWEKGGWRISRVKRIVVLTAVTAPKNADEDKVQDYLRWAHQDFALAMRIRKNDF